MRNHWIAFSALLLVGLSACGPSRGRGAEQLSVSQVSEGTVNAQALNIAPGQASVPVQVALERYRNTCVNRQHPTMFGMIEVPGQPIWYDPQFNMALNDARPDICIFTFGSRDPISQVVTTFSNARTPRFIRFQPTPSTYKGQVLYAAGEGK